MPLSFAALMCHAPIVVPAVGGAEARRCRRTTRAMRQVAARAVAGAPDRLVVVSPHAPRHRSRWAAWAGPVRGDLARFRASQVRADLPAADIGGLLDLPPVPPAEPLDHGAMVPLAFLVEAGWAGPTAVLALPWEPGGAEALGRRIADLPGRTALIASGDLSHRLTRGAPAGFHPDAASFDAAFVQALEQGDWTAAAAPPHRDVAAEDAVESTRVAMGAAGAPLHAEVLAYEGPWGVGYAEAVLYDPDPTPWAVAWRAVRAAARGERLWAPSGGPPSTGAFVTLHKNGRLRGCIGHLAPTREGLWAELATVGRAAALNDPRFPALGEDELDDLDLEVSLLQPPEPVPGPEALDPARFGCIVTAGSRRGVLLPDIDGVDTVQEQVAICRRKAGIGPHEPVRLERFTVSKVEMP